MRVYSDFAPKSIYLLSTFQFRFYHVINIFSNLFVWLFLVLKRIWLWNKKMQAFKLFANVIDIFTHILLSLALYLLIFLINIIYSLLFIHNNYVKRKYYLHVNALFTLNIKFSHNYWNCCLCIKIVVSIFFSRIIYFFSNLSNFCWKIKIDFELINGILSNFNLCNKIIIKSPL